MSRSDRSDRWGIGVSPENIPRMIRDSNQLCVWKAVPSRKGKINKVPHDPRTYRRLSTRADWSADIDTTLQAFDNGGGFDGIGFKVTRGWFVLDLDHCVDWPHIALKAQAIVARCATYTELSPSGSGLRIIGRGNVLEDVANHANGVEIYGGNAPRFVTLTGRPIHDVREVQDVDSTIIQGLVDFYRTRTPENTEPADRPALVDPVDLKPLGWQENALCERIENAADRSHEVARITHQLYAQGLEDGQVLSTLWANKAIRQVALDHRHGNADKALAYLWQHHCTPARARIICEKFPNLPLQGAESLQGAEPLPGSSACAAQEKSAKAPPDLPGRSPCGEQTPLFAGGLLPGQSAPPVLQTAAPADGSAFAGSSLSHPICPPQEKSAKTPPDLPGRSACGEQVRFLPDLPSARPPLSGGFFCEVAAHSRPAEQLIQGFFAVNEASLLSGQSNVGKSVLALDIAVCVASGKDWRERRVKRGSVIYLAVEAPGSVHARARAYVFNGGEKNLPVYIADEPIDLLNHRNEMLEALHRLFGFVRKHTGLAVGLVILDTLAMSSPGLKENDSDTMGKLGATIKWASHNIGRAHWMVVHHMGKDITRGARGHTVLKAAVDTEIELTCDDNAVVTGKIEKQRSLPGRGAKFWYQVKGFNTGLLDNFGVLETAPMIKHLNDAPITKGDPNDFIGRNSAPRALVESRIVELIREKQAAGTPLSKTAIRRDYAGVNGRLMIAAGQVFEVVDRLILAGRVEEKGTGRGTYLAVRNG